MVSAEAAITIAELVIASVLDDPNLTPAGRRSKLGGEIAEGRGPREELAAGAPEQDAPRLGRCSCRGDHSLALAALATCYLEPLEA